MRLTKGIAVLAALAAVTVFAAVPAEARDCRGGRCAKVAKVAHAKKLAAPAGYRAMKTTQRPVDRRHVARRGPNRVVWHGWAGDSFYLDGVRYRGGSRRGPATAYNNWEGGFNAQAFWVLHLRSF